MNKEKAHMETNTTSKSNEHRSFLGLLAFWTAVAAAGSITMIGITSFTAFNPPDWLRISTMVPLPFLVIASIGFGLAGSKISSSHNWSIAGLIISGLSVIAFIVMIIIGG